MTKKSMFLKSLLLGAVLVGCGATEKSASVAQQPETVTTIKQAEFVPNEVIVKFKEGSVATQSASDFDTVRTLGSGAVLMSLKDIQTQAVQTQATEFGVTADSATGKATLDAIAKLKASPNVLYAEPNYIFHALDVPNTPVKISTEPSQTADSSVSTSSVQTQAVLGAVAIGGQYPGSGRAIDGYNPTLSPPLDDQVFTTDTPRQGQMLRIGTWLKNTGTTTDTYTFTVRNVKNLVFGGMMVLNQAGTQFTFTDTATLAPNQQVVVTALFYISPETPVGTVGSTEIFATSKLNPNGLDRVLNDGVDAVRFTTLPVSDAYIPSEPKFGELWGMKAIYAPQAWNFINRSYPSSVTKVFLSHINIAVLDTGWANHEDISAEYKGGYDFVSNSSASGDGNGRDSDPSTPCRGWHGAHVAGTIGATENGKGVIGVQPYAGIVAVRVLGCYNNSIQGTTADIADGALWAAGFSVAGVPNNPNPVKVMNMSLGFVWMDSGYCPQVFQDAFRAINNRGVTIVAAAGNSASFDAGNISPGNCPNVITVAASDQSGATADFSTRNLSKNYVEVAAPGVDILSTVSTAEYAKYSGTSMSAPHVAGLVGLMYTIRPEMNSRDVAYYLQIAAQKSKTLRKRANCVGCGAGVIDAELTLKEVAAGPANTSHPYYTNFR